MSDTTIKLRKPSLSEIQEKSPEKLAIKATAMEKTDTDKYSVRCEFVADDDDERAPDDGIPYQFTWRGVFIGSILGCIVTGSNMYIGLKSGWSFGGSIFCAIVGWLMIKGMENWPTRFGGGAFGIKENCSVQTAASAAGGLGVGFVSAIPAMFQLGLMPPLNQAMTQLTMWTLAGAFYGLFFAIPLRKHFIINQKLVFPGALATAQTIRSLHAHSEGSENLAMKQSKWILFSMLGATLFKILSFFVPFLMDMNVLWWFGSLFNSQSLKTGATLFRWRLQWTTAFMGCGMLIGTNAVLSFMLGNVLAWGLISPCLFYLTTGIIQPTSPWGTSIKGGLVTAQFWNLWPGVVMMVVSSFTDIAFHYKTLYHGFKSAAVQLYNVIATRLGRNEIEMEGKASNDPVPQSEQIPTWSWVLGLCFSSIFTILVLNFFFSVSWYFGVLSIILGFLLAIIGTQASGEVGINPIGVIGKTTQFVFAPIPQPTPQIALKVNLIAGNVAGTCAAQTSEMIGDLKTGHLLRASPKSQFFAQIMGSFFGVASSVVVFWVFGTAYPCILAHDNGDGECAFETPAAMAWRGVAQALTTDVTSSIPKSSLIACLVFGLVSFVTSILRQTLLKKHAHLVPNMNVVGLAFVNPAPFMPLAALIGLCIGLLWKRYRPEHYEKYHVGLASGLTSGEGIGGIFHAIFTIAGLNQDHVATGWGCPNGIVHKCFS